MKNASLLLLALGLTAVGRVQGQTFTVDCSCLSTQAVLVTNACQAAVPDLCQFTNCYYNTVAPAAPLSCSQSPAAGTLVGPGVHEITLLVTDINGLGQSCMVPFQVINSAPGGANPVITCPPDQVLLACGGTPGSVPGAIGTFKTTASGQSGPVECTPPSGSTFPIGVTEVTCTATNLCGGSASCHFSITVRPPPDGFPCPPKQLGLGLPFELVGGATSAIRPNDGSGLPAVCIFPNAANPLSGILLLPGPAQAITFTTVLDFTADMGAGVDFVLPPNSMNSNNTPILSFRSKGPKGYCVKTNKRFADEPSGQYRSIAVNTNGDLLDSITFDADEAKTNDLLVIAAQPGVTNCHVTVQLNCVSGGMTIEFDGPVDVGAMGRKGWDGCIYGPDRPIKKGTARVIVQPPVSPGQPPITELYMYSSGWPEVVLEDPSITSAGRKWGDGHVTLMKAYDDGESLEFVATAPGGGVQVDLGYTESFDLRLTHFSNGDIPDQEQLLTRTIGPIRGLTNRPAPPFLDAMLLRATPDGVACSADFSNLGSPTVRVEIYLAGMLVAERAGVPATLSDTLFVMSGWADRLGKLGGATPCRRGKPPLGAITLPPGAGQPGQTVIGDEFRVLAELAPDAPHPDYYSGFEFISSPGARWGVTSLQTTSALTSVPLTIQLNGKDAAISHVPEHPKSFILQGAEEVTGPWYDLLDTPDAVIPAKRAMRMYRLRESPSSIIRR